MWNSWIISFVNSNQLVSSCGYPHVQCLWPLCSHKIVTDLLHAVFRRIFRMPWMRQKSQTNSASTLSARETGTSRPLVPPVEMVFMRDWTGSPTSWRTRDQDEEGKDGRTCPAASTGNRGGAGRSENYVMSRCVTMHVGNFCDDDDVGDSDVNYFRI